MSLWRVWGSGGGGGGLIVCVPRAWERGNSLQSNKLPHIKLTSGMLVVPKGKAEILNVCLIKYVVLNLLNLTLFLNAA